MKRFLIAAILLFLAPSVWAQNTVRQDSVLAALQGTGVFLNLENGGSSLVVRTAGVVAFNCTGGLSCSYDAPSGTYTMNGTGVGTVTSVSSGNFSPLFNVNVANPTTAPAFSFSAISQNQNLFFASPNGSSGTPTFRTMLAADVPAGSNSCTTHQFTISLASGLTVTCAQPVAADIGSIPGTNGQLLFNNSGAIGAEDPNVTVLNFPATQPVSGSVSVIGPVTVGNSPFHPVPVMEMAPVFGTVNVGNLPASQQVSEPTLDAALAGPLRLI